MISFAKNTGLLLLLMTSSFVYARPQNTTNKNILFEINPLLMANQGLGINGEFLFMPSTSFGTNLEFNIQTLYDRNSVEALRGMINVAPFARYYIFSPRLEGLFVGLKLNLTYSKSIIKDSSESVVYSKFYVAPSAHFGYRFVFEKGFTVSAYVGAGIKSASNRFPSSSLPFHKTSDQDWLNAQTKLNQNVSYLQPDYGLTVGFEF